MLIQDKVIQESIVDLGIVFFQFLYNVLNYIKMIYFKKNP